MSAFPSGTDIRERGAVAGFGSDLAARGSARSLRPMARPVNFNLYVIRAVAEACRNMSVVSGSPPDG